MTEPTPTINELIVEEFWREEMHAGYETALKLAAEKFNVPCSFVEKLLVEDDELNNGNI